MNRFRHLLATAATPVRLGLVGLIAAYRFVTSGLAPRCKYYPSCSAYAQTALQTHGVGKGVLLAAWRLLRCNPFSNGGVDHVPSVLAYASFIHRPGEVSGR